jgi:hypothetical protein
MGVFAGSTVWMANGRQKPVEELEVGDEVKDILGETRVVDGIRPLQYSTIGVSYIINSKYVITSQHNFFSADNKICSLWPHTLAPHPGYEIKAMYPYITQNNVLRQKWSWVPAESSGLVNRWYCDDPRWQDIYLNTIKGPEKVETIELIDMTNHDVMYSHSVTGSGTYYVGGLCCGARINETWDYEKMEPIDGIVTIVSSGRWGPDSNERVINIDHCENSHSCWCPDDQHWKNHTRYK